MAPLHERLVGRTDELDALETVLDELDRGHSGAVELVGEPGIGKTRLLRELAERAELRGQLVLSGSASELERDLPLSVFVDALDEYVEGLDPNQLTPLSDDVRAELAHVFPSLAELAGERQPAPQHERYRSHRAVRALLERLAETRPLVLMLDDLHWSDAGSVELLGALLRRPPTEPVLIALGRRPTQLPERLSAALERSRRAEALLRIDLRRLTLDEARELLGDTAGPADVAALYRESGGNPFYLEQLARSLDRASATRRPAEASPEDVGVPDPIVASLSEELASLSENGRRVLEGASVAGDPFEPELAAAAAARSEAEAMDAIDELLQHDLVRTTEAPRRFRFRHPLVRRTVYEAAPAAWRLGAHERCARALLARGARAASRAHHVERSAREGDLDAVAVLRDAGQESVRLAPASAAHWFAEALRLLPQSAPPEERVELLATRAAALTAAGRYEESHNALLDAIAIAPHGSHALRARLARACAGVETNLGRQSQAGDRLANALDELTDQSSPEAVALMLELVGNALWRTDHEAMHEAAERAADAARRLGDAAMTATALAELALADSIRGAPERAEANRSEAARLVDNLSDNDLGRHVEAAAWLAGVELYLDRYAEGEAHANRALVVARATSRGDLFLLLAATLGGLLRQRGKLGEAAELLDTGIEAARLLGNKHALAWTLMGRSSTALRSGDVELAIATAQESFELSQHADSNFHAAEAAADLAAALLETGQPEAAADLLLDSAGGEELSLIGGSPRARYLEVLTRCRFALGRHDEAARSAAVARDWASTVQLPMAIAWAERATAAVALDNGDPTVAAEHAFASITAADRAGAPVEAALSRMLAGVALSRAGERDRAAAELERAARDFEERGALRYRDAAEQELGKLGHRIHRRTRPGQAGASGIQSLTERELQVAHLVVDRMTNPQIAAQLFLSHKTVQTHLRNIFRKMDVSSRVELARAVERAERTGEPRS